MSTTDIEVPARRMGLAAEALAMATSAEAGRSIYELRYLPAVLDSMRAEADPADVLVMTVGSQPYSVATSLARTPARVVYFVHTAQSERSARQAMEIAGLAPEVEIRWREVGPADSVAVYRVVREAVEAHGEARVVIDFTSGTKAMTAGASTSAGYLRVDQIYIASVRLPGPFTCFGDPTVHRVDHPLIVFGDLERREAERAFDDARFELAEDGFRDLDEARVPGYHFGARVALCGAYRAWRALAFGEAKSGLDRTVALLDRTRSMPAEPLLGHRQRLKDQAAAVALLARATGSKAKPAFDIEQWSTLTRFLLASARREGTRMPDMGALLRYRALELAIQRRLAVYGIDAEASACPADVPDLLERYNALCSKSEHRLRAWPSKLALVQGHLMLSALGDAVVTESGIKGGAFHGPLQSRNRSIYAHGFSVLSEKSFEGFCQLVDTYVRLTLEADGLDPIGADDAVFDFVRFEAR